MKYSIFIQNARSKAEKFLRSGFAFVAILIIIVSLAAVFTRSMKITRANSIKAQLCFRATMETDMVNCLNIARKMQYAGANIKDELLPELRLYLYSLNAVSRAFAESFSDTDAPVNQQFLSKVTTAVERLERDYNCGYPAQKSEKALCECLNEFRKLIKNSDDGK